MNITEHNCIARCIHCMHSIALMPGPAVQFASADYRMMKTLEADCLLPGRQTEYNGNVKFVYLCKGYTPLCELRQSADADSLFAVMAALVSAARRIEENGFLSCSSIVLSPETVFVDAQSLAVRLIYFPFREAGRKDGDSAFMTALRAMLLSFLEDTPILMGDIRTLLLREMLLKETGSLQALSNWLSTRLPVNAGSGVPAEKSAASAEERISEPAAAAVILKNPAPVQVSVSVPVQPAEPEMPPAQNIQPKMVLRSITPSIRHSFVITKPRFEIGRNCSEGKADFSFLIGKKHCVILYENNCYYVMDLGSRGGTFLNNDSRLPANEKIPLKNGDRLKLGNISFLVLL